MIRKRLAGRRGTRTGPRRRLRRARGRSIGLSLMLALLNAPGVAGAGAYVFAGESTSTELVTHPMGYGGGGGVLAISVCVDPTSVHATEMETPVRNALRAFEALVPTTGNLVSGGSNDVPSGYYDFESVLLHELGHCLGLEHVNLGSESGLTGGNRNYTRSTDGADDGFDLNRGADNVKGSSDDLRGDDENLHWFDMAGNNPFTLAGTVDATTYSRDLADLPAGHQFAANGDRVVSTLLGVPGTEAVMQQGTFSDEAQRSMSHDDVATLRYAMAGIDELAGTPDDYSLDLVYAGLTAGCDVPIDFDDSETAFATSYLTGAYLPPTWNRHVKITSASVFFNDGYSWFFNDLPWDHCGNGVLEADELCDDGNSDPEDGCDATCQPEPGWSCAGEPSACAEVCGDGIRTASEDCDDGGTVDGDCCSAGCAFEPAGASCAIDANPCTDDVCDAVGQCQAVANADPCDDGDACTIGDACTGGSCGAGAPLVCDDGLFCNGAESCDSLSGCLPGTLVIDDGIACTDDICSEVDDVVYHLPDDTLCDDGDSCTDDVCSQTTGCSSTPVCGAPLSAGSTWTRVALGLTLLAAGLVASRAGRLRRRAWPYGVASRESPGLGST